MKLLMVSDIHANWPALEAVAEAEFTWDAVAFCGDAVDYGPFPVECIRWLREHATYLVRGNHDNALANDLDCRCLWSFRPYSLATRAWHRKIIGNEDLEYLRAMPTLAYFEWGGRHFRMSHATPTGDLFEYLPMEQWEERVRGLDADFVLLGHTHVQGLRSFGAATVVNPGSVGLARDEPGQACYAVYEDGQIHLKRIPYDVDCTIAALQQAPLPSDVIEGLSAVLRPQPAPSPAKENSA